MLVGLLPAFRQLRGPLVAGSILFLSLWIALRDTIPDSKQATGAIKALYELGTAIGTAGVLSAVAIAAALAGSLVQYLAETIGRLRNLIGNYIDSHPSSSPNMPSKLLKRTFTPARYDVNTTRVEEWIKQKLLDDSILANVIASQASSSDLSTSALATPAGLARRVVNEFPRIARRMPGKENELYDQYDRQIGEAQYREIIILPIIALSSVLAIYMSPWFAALATIVVPLKRQAGFQRRDGNEVVLDALVVGRVSSPSIERFERLADAARPTPSS